LIARNYHSPFPSPVKTAVSSTHSDSWKTGYFIKSTKKSNRDDAYASEKELREKLKMGACQGRNIFVLGEAQWIHQKKSEKYKSPDIRK
jgi:hypothetical protein